jgi:hypothetical protein
MARQSEKTIMTRILLDANLARQLKASTDSLELCDPNGYVVGHFMPIQKPRIAIPFSEEEIQTSRRKPGGRPLADILADLEKS